MLKTEGSKIEILATSQPNINAKIPKIRNAIASTAYSKKPLGHLGITKLTIRKGGDILDVLEQYENNDVKETILGGTRKKGGNDTFGENKLTTRKKTGVLDGKQK